MMKHLVEEVVLRETGHRGITVVRRHRVDHEHKHGGAFSSRLSSLCIARLLQAKVEAKAVREEERGAKS